MNTYQKNAELEMGILKKINCELVKRDSTAFSSISSY
jgi:hypothetical protein